MGRFVRSLCRAEKHGKSTLVGTLVGAFVVPLVAKLVLTLVSPFAVSIFAVRVLCACLNNTTSSLTHTPSQSPPQFANNPPFREIGVAIPISHRVSQTIPFWPSQKVLSQQRGFGRDGVTHFIRVSSGYRAMGGIAQYWLANCEIVGH